MILTRLHPDVANSPQLVRRISQWDFIALIVNITVGAGILGLPAKVFALLGVNSLWAFAGCAVLMLALILCFAEVGSRFRGTGGPYLYTLATLGPLTGFVAGWLLWLSRLFSFASVCNLLMDYTAFLWPPAGQGLIRIVLILSVIIILAAINHAGIRKATIFNNGITICKLLILFLFVAVGLFFVHPLPVQHPRPLTLSSLASAVLLLVFAFSGFDVAAVPAGEVREPQKTVPHGLLIGLSIVTLLYIGIQQVCMGTLPKLAQSAKPVAEAARTFMGGTGTYLITAGALITMLGTLNALMLTSSRLLFALAEQRQLPQWLTLVHRTRYTPYPAIILSALVLVILTLNGSFLDALTISAIIRLFTFITTCIALLVLRRQTQNPAPFSIKSGSFLALCSIVLCLLLLVNIKLQEAVTVAWLAGAGVIIYSLYTYFKKPF